MAATRHIYLTNLHTEHKDWLNQLLLFENEIIILKHRLEEIIRANTSNDIRANVEQLENKLMVHKEFIDTYKAKINKHEHELFEYASENPVAVDHVHFEDHSEMREDIEKEIKLFEELKGSFNTFLSKSF